MVQVKCEVISNSLMKTPSKGIMVGSGWAEPGRARPVRYRYRSCVQKKRFMFFKPYRKKKSIVSEISRCLKVLYDCGKKLSTTGLLATILIYNYLYRKSIFFLSIINM